METPGYKNYLLGLLTVIALFNFVDRIALGLMLQDIKTEFDLTDTQLGLLTGIAFTLFYAVMGIPIARWADRGNRVTIIALTTALWSVMVAVCGMVTSFVQLLLIRAGVAVGEAGCMPPALSLMADHFSRAERPRAASIYRLGEVLSFLIGSFLAGWLIRFYGWRVTFMLLGTPGVLLAMLAGFTLKEPRRAQSAIAGTAASERGTAMAEPTLKEVWKALWSNATFRNLLLCTSVLWFFGYGLGQWQPAFLIRSFGLSTTEIGAWFGAIACVGGLAGAYIGGTLASRHAANNERLQLKGMAVVCGMTAAMWVGAYLSSSLYLTMAFIGIATIGLYAISGPLFATIQTVVPERMRAVAFALVLLFANLIGMGLGPLAAGVMSDAFRPWAGQESLRYALLILSPGYLWAGWHVWRASRSVTRDLTARSADVEGVPVVRSMDAPAS